MEKLIEDIIIERAIENADISIGFIEGDGPILDQFFAVAHGIELKGIGFTEEEALDSLKQDLRAHFIMNLSEAKELASQIIDPNRD